MIADIQLPKRLTITLDELRMLQGKLVGSSDWITIDQSMIDHFAQLTGDDAFIHTNPTQAAATRFRGTIAHGLLTLSLLPLMMRTAMPVVLDKRMGVNYGYDRVRFTTPVPVNQRIRGKFSFTGMTERSTGFLLLSYEVKVEIEGCEVPALVAEWLLGVWSAGKP